MVYSCITLTTDIGWEYAAQMKGVIASIAPSIRIIDISHSISPQNVLEGAFVLYSIVPYFPQGVHIGVIDPGVGTNRRMILVECTTGALVGPDNGVLIPAGNRLGIKAVYQITNPTYCAGDSHVFQGRDIFSPVSAHLTQGVDPAQMGEKITDYVTLDFGRSHKTVKGRQGRILYQDAFGNLITNITRDELGVNLGDKVTLEIEKRVCTLRFLTNYGQGDKNELLILPSSFGFLEISCRDGNAHNILGLKGGDMFTLIYP